MERLKEMNKIMNECWQVLKKYAMAADNGVTEALIEESQTAVREIYVKHPTRFTKDVCLAVLDELARIYS